MANQKVKVPMVDGTVEEVTHQRPPRWVFWKHSIALTTFQKKLEEIAEGSPAATPAQQAQMAQQAMANMTDQEAATYQECMDAIVKHSHHPQLKVNDMTEEGYWHLVALTMYAKGAAKVETKDGDTTAEVVDSFREKPGVSGGGEEVPDIRPKRGKGRNGSARPSSNRRHRQPRKRAAQEARP